SFSFVLHNTTTQISTLSLHDALPISEARQPLSGFSPDLKASEDCRRYYFFHSIAGRRLPVHILFSPSAQQAEVKTGDMKALRIRSEEHTSELQSPDHLVCRLLVEKKR